MDRHTAAALADKGAPHAGLSMQEGYVATRIAGSNSTTRRIMTLVVLTTAIALLLAGIALAITDLQINRREQAENLSTEASILAALATAPAFSLYSHFEAERALGVLQTRPSIAAAVIYSADRKHFASYVRSGETGIPDEAPEFGPQPRIEGQRIEVLHPIVRAGNPIGWLYLRANYDMTERVRTQATILGVVMILSLIVALATTAWLRRVISSPMRSIVATARDIVHRGDYSLRAAPTTSTELNVVVDAFNRMLDEVQVRTDALEESNQAMREEVRVRKAAEQALAESEQLYRAIGESINFGVWVCDAQGRNTYISDSFLQLVGLTQEQCSAYGWAELLHPDDREDTIRAWKACVRDGSVWYREHRMRGTDGQYHPILAHGLPIRDGDGRITRWAGINLDISRLKMTEQALRDAHRRKDEFLATLSHELRNPLAPIRNAVRILEMPAADERQRRWGREVISRQVHHMALLLDDLLDVSRITRSQLELRKDYVALQSIVDVALETARPFIDAKNHAVSVHLPPETLTLEVDPLRMSQVLANLFTNAAKYTDANGRIELTAKVVPAGLQISVKDTGVGLSPETIPKLFTMFSQVTSSIDRAEGGLGIGLALVKGLVVLHGGTVEARSEGLGRGSEFIIHLPQSAIAQQKPRSVSGRPIYAVQRTGAKILIADDNRDAAETLAAVLRHSGYTVLAAFSGPEALDLAAREHPQIVLTDIGMPGMSGHEVARRLRLEAWGRHAMLVALTGWGHDEQKQAALAAGFDEHLTKPVDPSRVEQLVATWLSLDRGEPEQAARGDRI